MKKTLVRLKFSPGCQQNGAEDELLRVGQHGLRHARLDKQKAVGWKDCWKVEAEARLVGDGSTRPVIQNSIRAGW